MKKVLLSTFLVWPMMMGSQIINPGTGGGSSAVQITATFLGALANSQVIFYAPTTVALTLPASCAGSYMTSTIAATGSTAILIRDLTASATLCTATFSASGTTATFSGTGGTIAAGHVIQIIGPGTADATLANLGVAIAASR